MPKDKDSSPAPTPAAPARKKSAEKAGRRTVRVRATKLGFYGHMLRPIGTVFNITIGPDEKWPSWVEKIGVADRAELTQEETSPETEQSEGSGSDDVL